MATEKDITDHRDSDIELLDKKISAAITKKNGLAISDPRRLRLSTTINQLMDSRTDLHIQELKAGLDSAQLATNIAFQSKCFIYLFFFGSVRKNVAAAAPANDSYAPKVPTVFRVIPHRARALALAPLDGG